MQFLTGGRARERKADKVKSLGQQLKSGWKKTISVPFHREDLTIFLFERMYYYEFYGFKNKEPNA